MQGKDNIELRSEEIHDILTRPPHALVRWGTTVICSIILLLIIGSFFFRYPDIVPGDITITTENPPAWIIAKTNGKIKELFCADNQTVTKGEILAVIENPASTDAVLRLKSDLQNTVVSDTLLSVPPGIFSGGYELGGIQSSYSSFLRAVTDYQNFLSLNLIEQEKVALRSRISGYRVYSSNLEKQVELKGEEMEVARKSFEREKELYAKGIISKADLEASEQNFLSIRQAYQQMQASLATNQIESSQLNQSASKLSVQYQQDRNRLYSALKAAYSELLSVIEDWEQIYLLRTPMDGVVTFNNFWQQNQYVTLGDRVFVVVPHQPGAIIGKIRLPVEGSGKVKTGQRVNIKIAGYPYMEYGALQGRIRSMSLVANDKFYYAETELPQGLQTTTRKMLDFTGELSGTAEIVTEDRALAERIISPLRYLIKNHWK